MKKMKKVLAVVCVLSMIMGLTGCGMSMPKTASKILEQVNKNMNSKELDASMVMNMDMDMLGQNTKMVMNSDMIIFEDPLKAKITSTIDMGSLGKSEGLIYMNKESDKYWMYTNMSGSWQKASLSKDAIETKLNEYQGQTDISMYLTEKDSFKIVKEEKLAGRDCTLLEGKLSKESIQKVMDEAMSQQAMASSDILKDMTFEDGMSVKIWVDNNNVTVSRIYLDMTSIMSTVMNKVMESLSSTVSEEDLKKQNLDKSSLQVTVNKYDIDLVYHTTKDVKNFDIPDEAKNASEIAEEAILGGGTTQLDGDTTKVQ